MSGCSRDYSKAGWDEPPAADEANRLKIREQIRAVRELGFRLEALKAKAETAVMEDAQADVEYLITQYNEIAPSNFQVLSRINLQTLFDDGKALNKVIMKLKDKDTELLKDLKVIESSESPNTKENDFIEVCKNQVFGKGAASFVLLRHQQEKTLRESNLGDDVTKRLDRLESDLKAHVHD